jgi:two-component system, LuxR family, response regulator DctR
MNTLLSPESDLTVSGTVFIVDDDEALRDALRMLLRSRGLQTELFSSGESFLESISLLSDCTGTLLLDVRMPGISGIQVFDELLSVFGRAPVPVIFLTGHADVPMAVESLKKGAFDFFEKPFDNNKLLDRLGVALRQSAEMRQTQRGERDVKQALAALTEREREVMKLIVAGRLNKVIADELAISMRTVEVHRSRIFSKMGVRSAVELANLLKAN